MPLENEMFENLFTFKNNEANNDLSGLKEYNEVILKKEMINNLKR